MAGYLWHAPPMVDKHGKGSEKAYRKHMHMTLCCDTAWMHQAILFVLAAHQEMRTCLKTVVKLGSA